MHTSPKRALSSLKKRHNQWLDRRALLLALYSRWGSLDQAFQPRMQVPPSVQDLGTSAAPRPLAGRTFRCGKGWCSLRDDGSSKERQWSEARAASAAQQQRKRGVEGRIIEKKDPEDEGEDSTRAGPCRRVPHRASNFNLSVLNSSFHPQSSSILYSSICVTIHHKRRQGMAQTKCGTR